MFLPPIGEEIFSPHNKKRGGFSNKGRPLFEVKSPSVQLPLHRGPWFVSESVKPPSGNLFFRVLWEDFLPREDISNPPLKWGPKCCAKVIVEQVVKRGGIFNTGPKEGFLKSRIPRVKTLFRSRRPPILRTLPRWKRNKRFNP